jgi:hypothetical protein
MRPKGLHPKNEPVHHPTNGCSDWLKWRILFVNLGYQKPLKPSDEAPTDGSLPGKTLFRKLALPIKKSERFGNIRKI